MNRSGIKPNAATFTEVLFVISRSGTWNRAKGNSLKVMREMKRLGVAPTAGTWFNLLSVHTYAARGKISPILSEILDEIEEQEFKIEHPTDVQFFTGAMEVATEIMNDIDVAHRVHAMLQKGENWKLLADSLLESKYYAFYFKLIAQVDSFDELMDFYNKYVPNIYTPEPSVMLGILEAANLYDRYDVLPLLWTDIVSFGMHTRENIVLNLLSMMAKEKQDDTLQSQFVAIMEDVAEKLDAMENDEERMWRPIQWTAEMISHEIQIYVNGGELTKAAKCMERLLKNISAITGFTNPNSLIAYCDAMFNEADLTYLNLCLKYCEEVGETNVLDYCVDKVKKLPESDFKKDLLTRLSDYNSRSTLSEIVAEDDDTTSSSSSDSDQEHPKA